MAAIAPNQGLRLLLAITLASAALSAPVRADDAPDLRAALGKIANSLTANDPSEAMQPFSKSFANYGKLRDYFTGLTNGFTIVNEVDVIDQQDLAAGTQATVRWSMTVSSTGGNQSTQRMAEIHLRMSREKKGWKIVDFSPIDLFDPTQAQTPNSPGGVPPH